MSKFKMEDLKDHVLKEFPEICWAGVCELITYVGGNIISETVAVTIIAIVKFIGIDKATLEKRLDILRLKSEFGFFLKLHFSNFF